MNVITLAENFDLVGPYNKTIGALFSTQAGTVIKNIGAFLAVVIILLLVAALICRATTYAPSFASRFAGSIPKIVLMLLVAFILAGPAVTFPFLLNVGQRLMNGVGNTGMDFFNS